MAASGLQRRKKPQAWLPGRVGQTRIIQEAIFHYPWNSTLLKIIIMSKAIENLSSLITSVGRLVPCGTLELDLGLRKSFGQEHSLHPFFFAESYRACLYLHKEPLLKSYLRDFFKESLSSQKGWGDYQCLILFSLQRTNFSYLAGKYFPVISIIVTIFTDSFRETYIKDLPCIRVLIP